LITAVFPDHTTFGSFCRQHLPEFQEQISSQLSIKGMARELVQFMERRRRLDELLGIFQAVYPAHYQQHTPYERGEKPYEKQKREVMEKLALSQEAAKILTAEVTRQEKLVPNGFALRQAWSLKTQRNLKSLAWIPESEQLFTFTADGIIQTWASTTGEPLTRYQLNTKEIAHFAVPMPNGLDALLLAGPRQKKTLRIIELSSGKVRVNIPDVDPKAAAAAISSDGTWAATKGGSNSLQVWNLAKAYAGDVRHGHLQEVTAVLMQPISNRVISAGKDETIRIWNEKGEAEHTLSGPNGPITLMAVSPDGRFLAAVAEKSNEIFVWQLPQPSRGFMAQFRKENPQLVARLNGHKGRVTALSFSANGRFLASKSYDYTLRLWDCASWATTRQLMSTLGPALACHPKRPLLAVGSDSGQQVHIWELKL
ncbi:MAG: WD40 repeat domain-containing protein, partial [Anaerolineales bacterium]|nr:WD40 repeat domain-containing protein [Anaerolineales bacterium]